MIVVTVGRKAGKYSDLGNETTDTSVIGKSETSPTPTDASSHNRQADMVQNSTTHFFSALAKQPSRPGRVAVLLVGLVAMVALLGAAPDALAGQSGTSVDPRPPTSIGDPVGAERIAIDGPSTTTTTPESGAVVVRTPGPALAVPDPRPGDLRVDPTGDVLPSDYTAAPAREIVRDLAYGPDPIHLLDLYLPGDDLPIENAPVVVFLHSGGWIGGDRSYVPDMVLRFVERGYAVASVDYSLAPEHPFPAPITDVKRAIRELKAYGDETGLIDPDHIVLYGTSAGGHIAAFVAATPGEFEPADLSPAAAAHDSSVAGIVVAVGPVDLTQMYSHPNAWARPMSGAHAGCEPCTVEQLELPSVRNHLHGELPPAYWAYGDLDPLVDAELQGRAIADAWGRAAGSEYSWFDLVDNGDHNLDETLVNQRLIEAFVDLAVGR